MLSKGVSGPPAKARRDSAGFEGNYWEMRELQRDLMTRSELGPAFREAVAGVNTVSGKGDTPGTGCVELPLHADCGPG